MDENENNPFSPNYKHKPGEHSKTYKFIEAKLGYGSKPLTQKERYEQEKQKLETRLENMNYKNKIQDLKIANKKLNQAQFNDHFGKFKKKIGLL